MGLVYSVVQKTALAMYPCVASVSITESNQFATIDRVKGDAIECSRRARRVEVKLLHRLAYTSSERSPISRCEFPKMYSSVKIVLIEISTESYISSQFHYDTSFEAISATHRQCGVSAVRSAGSEVKVAYHASWPVRFRPNTMFGHTKAITKCERRRSR